MEHDGIIPRQRRKGNQTSSTTIHHLWPDEAPAAAPARPTRVPQRSSKPQQLAAAGRLDAKCLGFGCSYATGAQNALVGITRESVVRRQLPRWYVSECQQSLAHRKYQVIYATGG